MGQLMKPENFNMKDLYLSVNLETCIDGKSYDFTGRKTFNTSFYRENIGFGITDIKIEISTSLQPIIDITFKDLYGNTLFGTQRTDNEALDTSVFFNWPPPKFIFSFKGYLGHEVTWLLNLKTTNVSYVPSDSSYEVKCSFVPNQWGFLSDMPALYLLACKKLRYEAYGNKDDKFYEEGGIKCDFKTDSVFSYTRIGKMVDTKTTEETTQFDSLIKQLNSIKYGLSSAVFGSKIINIDEPIIGVVNSIPISGFTNVIVTAPSSDIDRLKDEYKDSRNIKRLDSYLKINVKSSQSNDLQTSKSKFIASAQRTYDSIDMNGSSSKTNNTNNDDLSTDLSMVNNVIDENLKLIDNEIKRRIFSSTKAEIGKLTIGEVFRQLARDSGFILGSILQEGFMGYAKNIKSRSGESGGKELIGKSFPLFVNDDGEELPAVKPLDSAQGNGPKGDYGVAKCEMKFVDKFISAIGEGIAENLINDDIASSVSKDVPKRINNLEAIQPNPYKPFYTNIAENVLIRSGIIAYVTRSDKPEAPGDYGGAWYKLGADQDSEGNIISLSNSDIENNLTKDILSQLTFEDRQSLKRFCLFFDKLICDSQDDKDIGTHFLMPYTNQVNLDFDLANRLSSPDQPVSDDVLDYEVLLEPINTADLSAARKAYDALSVDDKANPKKIIETVSAIFPSLSLRKLMSEILKPVAASYVENSPQENSFRTPIDTENDYFYNSSLINPSKLTAYVVKNNGVYYSFPKTTSNQKYYILYDRTKDIEGVLKFNAGAEEKNFDDSEPIGFIPIKNPTKDKSSNSTLGRITRINQSIALGLVIDYNKVKKSLTTIDSNGEVVVDPAQYKVSEDTKIQSKLVKFEGEIPAENLAYTVYTHSIDTSDGEIFPNLVFGPFCNVGKRSLNQRVSIKTMCKAILKKLDEIDVEKNEMVASIIGKAGEHRNSIYKQMHTIFHQWQILASSVANKGELCSSYDDLKQIEKNNLALILEKEFGMCTHHVEKGTGTSKLANIDIGTASTLFVYDYPLSPVRNPNKPINVKNAIINIEALYKPNSNTTVLNIIQQICTKNNFVFVPFPGDANSDNLVDVYVPQSASKNKKIRNYFHVLFTPTPETRSKLSNDKKEFLTDYMRERSNFQNDALVITFGGVNNQIVKSINVGTDSTKPTVESILNLQKLVDKENTYKKTSMDCSMLPIYEGRSYKASVEMIGNAQVYPMQYFYIMNQPMFGGLYQILKVNHSITPNDMSTNIEGIRMRFSEINGYGGIPPITLEDLKELGNVAMPLVNSETPYQSAIIANIAAAGGTFGKAYTSGAVDIQVADSFIQKVKDVKFKKLSDVDTFFAANSGYKTFLEFFNATQANIGYYATIPIGNGLVCNPVGKIGMKNLTPMMNNIELLYPGGANFFELFANWCSSLTESGAECSVERVGIKGHPGLSYAFDSIGSKSSYNTSNGNKTAYDSLNNVHFINKFNSSFYYNKNLLRTEDKVWKGTDMPKIPGYVKLDEKNVLAHTDFNKFRGRGFIQITGRAAYRNVLSSIFTSISNAKISSKIPSYWIANKSDIEKVLTISTNAEWDTLFLQTDGAVACIAHRNYLLNSLKNINVNINGNSGEIVNKMLAIGGAATCGCNVVTAKVPDFKRKYGLTNVARVAQIISELKIA